MNLLDIIIIVILGFCLIRGIFRGIVKELASIVGVVAGLYAAYTYYTYVSRLLTQWISNSGYRNILAIFLIFCLVMIFIGVLGILIKYALKIAHLGWFDRICGAGFGSIKGILIVSVIIFMLTTFLPGGTPVVRDSLLAPHVMMLSEKIVLVVPDDMKRKFTDKFKELQKSWRTRKTIA